MANRILGIFGWIGTALVVAAVAIWLATRTEYAPPATWDPYRYYLSLAGLVFLLAYTAGQWREIVKAFSGRSARYGTLASVSVLVVLGILIAINYIGRKQNKRWDTTESQQFTISDQSRNVLQKLDAPLQLLVFAEETNFRRYQDRLREYEYTSNQVSTQYIDPDKSPTVAQQNQVQQYGTIVINYKGRTERVTSDTEQDITNGIIKAVTGAQKKVYFTQGHGEKDTATTERDGYSGIAEALGRENYTIEKFVLAQAGQVPSDAAMVVVAGPQNDFLAPEVDALKKYLGASGKLLLALDPPAKAGGPDLTNLIGLAREYGIDVGKDIVLDVSGMGRLIGASEAMPVAATYPTHPITERFNVMTVFPMTRSVVPVSGGVEGRTAQPVVQTGERSWAESDLAGLFASQPAELDESKGDKPGPVGIAAAVSVATSAGAEPPKPEDAEAPKPETRLVVFGDSDFATNGTLGIPGNRDLFMNAMGWLSQQENLIAIRPKTAADRRITMTAAQQSNILWLSLLVIPGAVFGTGIYSWWRRRG
jgi:ABC-type uncharacterized transport system involved in gliding motility auxiliary subunit